MKRLALSLLIVAACKHASSSSSTSHSETQTTTESSSSETGYTTTTTVVTEAPGKTTTTVEDYANGPDSSGDVSADGGEREPGTDPDGGVAVARAAPPPRLVRRTVTVTERGAETTETHQQASTQAQGATETKAAGKADTQAQAQSASAPAASCVSLGWLWGAIVLVGVVGVLYGVIKFRRAV